MPVQNQSGCSADIPCPDRPGDYAQRDKTKVLVADDEHVIADTLAMILNQSGFEAHAVYSGETALELAEPCGQTCSSPT